MLECSVTITCGVGSEQHNHDTQYRSSMEHIVSGPEDVIELIPYIPYNTRINDIIRPYIDQYNHRRDEKYADAMDRYQRGELKHRPNRSNYAHMDYDYASTHATSNHRHQTTGRVEADPIFRSAIIGLGDQHDRQKISREQAIAVFSAVATVFPTVFPFFLLLGFTLHLDEKGFYHAHCDYFVSAPKNVWKTDLPIYRGHDKALQLMGYKPEQSIVTATEKQPLYFNAFRNRLYRIMEHAMDKEQLRLQYGISEAKYPYKDPDKNMRLDVWQNAQDRFCALQHYRNLVTELLCRPDMQVSDIRSAAAIIHRIQTVVSDKDDQLPITLLHGYQVTSALLNRYIAAATRIIDDTYTRIQTQQDHLQQMHRTISALQEQRDQLLQEINSLQQVQRNAVTVATPVPQGSSAHQADAPTQKALSMDEWMDMIKQERNATKGSCVSLHTTRHIGNRERD